MKLAKDNNQYISVYFYSYYGRNLLVINLFPRLRVFENTVLRKVRGTR